MDDLARALLRHLAETPFACSSLSRHPGSGTTNFVLRGVLVEPRDGGLTKTVIVKHSTTFAAVNKNFPVDAARSKFEKAMLDALANIRDPYPGVAIPRLLMFDRERNTQVLEDYHDTVDLTTLLKTWSTTNEPAITTRASSIGRRGGAWLRSFHDWASASPQAGLRKTMGGNGSMRELKEQISYGSFMTVLQNSVPRLLDEHREKLAAVRNAVAMEFQLPASHDGGSNWGLVHGDFWSGNVLVPADVVEDSPQLVIIDWEFAQIGHRAIDLGQMIGDLLERNHYRGAPRAMNVMRSFVQGYGPVDDDLAFRTAIHAGVHLICWKIRGSPVSAREEAGMILGMDLVLKGWEKDRRWFGESVLAPLFGEAHV